MSELEECLSNAKSKEESGNFFEAAFLYKEVISLAQKAQNSKTIKLCKNKIVEMNQKSKDSFKEIPFEASFPTAFIDKTVNAVIDSDIKITLKNIGLHPHLYTSTKRIKKSSEHMSVMRQLASNSTISNDGHLIKGGTDPVRSWYFQNFDIEQGLIINLYLEKIFKKIMQDDKLNKKNLLLYFQEAKLFTIRNLELIKIGLDRYFEKDYVSAIHILIPQFESSFLYISNKQGIDVVRLNRGEEISTENKILGSDKLKLDEFRKVWGDDFCDQIDFILFEPLGYKLRHKVAHGEITTEECNFKSATLIIQLFLTICARIEVASEK